MDENADPVIRQYREQISDNDRALVEALNKRLRLVAELRKYKETRGIEFVDVAREWKGSGRLRDRAQWLAECQERKRTMLRKTNFENVPMKPQRVYQCLNRAFDD